MTQRKGLQDLRNSMQTLTTYERCDFIVTSFGGKVKKGKVLSMNDEKRICLLDLNYTLVGNQMQTRMLRPFSRRMEQEEYRTDLIEAIKDDYVIIVTARPNYQQAETMANVLKKTGWKPAEVYFNDINGEPPAFKESALKRFIFPKYGTDGSKYYAVESNPKTRAMYAKYGIEAEPYSEFIKKVNGGGNNQLSFL